MRFAAPRDSAEAIEASDRAAAAVAAASARALRAVAEVDRGGLWRRDGATSFTSWLAGRYGLAWGTARKWVRVARALEASRRWPRPTGLAGCPGTSSGPDQVRHPGD